MSRSSASSDLARAASRARILEAARALFAERGFAGSRIADVAARAQMSPGNVYWHFASKEAVLGAILADGFGNLEAMTAQVAGEYGPARRKLDILVDRTLDLYGANAEFTAILGGLTGDGGTELIRSLGIDAEAIAARAKANLRSVFAEARAEAAVVSTADPDQLAVLFLAFFDGMLVGHRDAWRGFPREVLRDAALRLVGYRPAG